MPPGGIFEYENKLLFFLPIVIAGFGSGALFFTPMMNMLSARFAKMPEYLGKSIETVTDSGKLFAKVGDSMQEIVYATGADLAKLPYSDLAEGFYVVGSGNTGVAGQTWV